MTSLSTDNKASILTKVRRTVSSNFVDYKGDNVDKVIEQLQTTCESLVAAVKELQSLQVASRTVADDLLIANKSRCEIFDGQFVRMSQVGAAGGYIRIEHGLGRKPQGAVFVVQFGLTPSMYITGNKSAGIPPADEKSVYFRFNGSDGDTNICVIF